MKNSDLSSYDCIMLDACCVLNLYASGYMDAILQALSTSVAVAAYIKDKEALRILCDPDGTSVRKYEQIDLQPFIDRGSIVVVSPDSVAEDTTYVNFAVELDDGEAITGAIAIHRHWSVASDDRKAIAFFGRNASHVQIVTTPEILQFWVSCANLDPDTVGRALRNIRIRARYEPDRGHILYDWWQKNKDTQ
jgi:hypothetical protein